MKIIKPGKIPETKRFECRKCGCIFEATNSEYEEEKDTDCADIYYWAINCPCCREKVIMWGNK